ncbi:unnamed protein product [Caenorhabditis auriculariae]|uniref:UDENN FLCN/SMCR8-type domain-containing protein n=1 Tax=Caenorhabditis auriculariae TaxID=2777116 RepID=A0A8S1GY65_9PELO|nr:unnamed protein product [Caenorhabditis auriculariae]
MTMRSRTHLWVNRLIGPRPLTIVSSDPNNELPGVDINSLAVWLMSSETAPTTVVVLDNNQTGISAIAYYFTIYDIRARAFQRPLCVAFLSSDRPTKDHLRAFEENVINCLAPVISCNRRFFLRSVADIVKLSDSMDLSTIQQYYTLNSDGTKVPDMNRLTNVLEQTRILKSRVLAVDDSEFNRQWPQSKCVGHEVENLEDAEEILRSFRSASVPLQPVETLAPCAFVDFKESLRTILTACTKLGQRSGVLFSSGTPIMKLPRTETSLQNYAEKSQEENNKSNDETLRLMTTHLADIIYPILCGDDLVVCGSEQRKKTVMDVVEKLCNIAPAVSGNLEKARWLTDRLCVERGVFGLKCAKGDAVKSLRNVVDMNRCVLKGTGYDGSLLIGLTKRRRFPSDQALLAFLAAYFTDLCSLAYVARNLPHQKLNNEHLSKSDERIILSFLAKLDFIKYHALKTDCDIACIEKPCKIVNL